MNDWFRGHKKHNKLQLLLQKLHTSHEILSCPYENLDFTSSRNVHLNFLVLPFMLDNVSFINRSIKVFNYVIQLGHQSRKIHKVTLMQAILVYDK